MRTIVLPIRQHVPLGTVPGGEARNIHVGNGRYTTQQPTRR